MGCDGFVTKPCLPDDLVNRIRAVLDSGRKKKKRCEAGRADPAPSCCKLPGT